MLVKLHSSLFILLLTATIALGQEAKEFDLTYEIHKTYPQLSISESTIDTAIYLTDLVPQFKTNWVAEYFSVEIQTLSNNQIATSFSKSAAITAEQKALLQNADRNSEIKITIKYLPQNSMSHNDPKELKYAIKIDPMHDAKFETGDIKLKQYIKEEIVEKISTSIFEAYNLTAVNFKVDSLGQVYNVHLFETTDDEATDQILLDAICNMPRWTPAQFANGQKTEQSFAFTAGDLNSCTFNLINIYKRPPQ